MSILVRASGLGKSYPKVHLRRDRARALWHLLWRKPMPDALQQMVLRDISFEVPQGQSLGVIGTNGAGKSTLLKLLTGVLSPTEGTVETQGRIGALLELGAGFHAEYTGRENIELSATLLGIDKQTLKSKRDEIIDFADIGIYIDEPVKHYSSGMVVRLGFAILAITRPDLLITDEVLAVGDESFQKKCVRWLEDYLKQGGTMLLVSHSMYHIQKLCSHALWLKDGRIAKYGDVFEVTQAYLAWHDRKQMVDRRGEVESSDLFRITRVLANGDDSDEPIGLEEGQPLQLEVDIQSPDAEPGHVLIGLTRADGGPIYSIGSEIDAVSVPMINRIATYRLELSDLPLLPGHYQLRVHAMDAQGLRLFDSRVRDIVIRGKTRAFGFVRLPYRWL